MNYSFFCGFDNLGSNGDGSITHHTKVQSTQQLQVRRIFIWKLFISYRSFHFKSSNYLRSWSPIWLKFSQKTFLSKKRSRNLLRSITLSIPGICRTQYLKGNRKKERKTSFLRSDCIDFKITNIVQMILNGFTFSTHSKTAPNKKSNQSIKCSGAFVRNSKCRCTGFRKWLKMEWSIYKTQIFIVKVRLKQSSAEMSARPTCSKSIFWIFHQRHEHI